VTVSGYNLPPLAAIAALLRQIPLSVFTRCCIDVPEMLKKKKDEKGQSRENTCVQIFIGGI
jgi:hypothetical protein